MANEIELHVNRCGEQSQFRSAFAYTINWLHQGRNLPMVKASSPLQLFEVDADPIRER
jgi:hypothetical protein